MKHCCISTALFLLVGCFLCSSAAARNDAGERAPGIVVEKDITYRKVGDVVLKLDLARPEGEGPFPAIVFVHGGGWRNGARTRFSADVEHAARYGYVAATVSYRLTDADENGVARNPFPAQIHDVKAAVRWLRQNAATYGIDTERIGATGSSAGGHLVLLLGTTDGSDEPEGKEAGDAKLSSRVQAVVNYFGPTDLARLYETSPGTRGMMRALLGGPPSEHPQRYAAASPVTHASGDDPPILTIHGTADKLVPIEQAERLEEALTSAGGSHTLLRVQGAAHGYTESMRIETRDACLAFFDQHLKVAR